MGIDRLLRYVDTIIAAKSDVKHEQPEEEEHLPNSLKKIFGELASETELSPRVKTAVEAVVSSVDPDFRDLPGSEKLAYLSVVRARCEECYEKIYKEKEYRRLGLLKQQTLQGIRENRGEDIQMLYLSDFFSISILRTTSGGDVKLFYSEEKFNRYKPLCIVYEDASVWHSVISNGKSLMAYNDRMMSRVVELTPDVVSFGKKQREFTTGLESLDMYLKRYCISVRQMKQEQEEQEEEEEEEESILTKEAPKKKLIDEENLFEDPEDNDTDEEDEEEEETEVETQDSVFIVNKKAKEKMAVKQQKTPELDIVVSTKMKKAELQKIAEGMDISLKIKNRDKTKAQLCEEINAKME